MNIIESICLDKNSTILCALERMDELNRKLLILTNQNKFYSLLSIGDIQRAILAKVELTHSVSSITRKDIRVARKSDDLNSVKAHMRIMRNEFMPIISVNNEIIDVIFWNDLFEKEKLINKANLNIPVVIMAGGKGSRLKPITNILPKPLIPLGEKTIVEEIMDEFVDAGCHKFFISVNYKADLIKYYFNSLKNSDYDINYFQEDKPLGTAGSMFLIKDKINSSFFVTNCDILIKQDLQEVYNYHKENKHKITIISVLKHYYVPYGTLETGINGALINLTEKPKITFQINSGMYLLEPDVLAEIPENSFFHITDLIDKIHTSGGKIGVFPISEGSWKDIGDWGEYLKNMANDK